MSFYAPISPSRRPTFSGISVTSHVPTLSSMAPSSIYHQEYGTQMDDADDQWYLAQAGALYGQPGADSALTHSDTLLTPEMISTTKDTAGLDSLLGNSYSRLKSGASVRLSHPRVHTSTRTHTPLMAVANIPLEQAKNYARVELDMILANNTCVQGSSIRGQIKVCVRKDAKGEGPVWLAKGKMRIIGFECINNEDRHTFLQYTVPLTSITPSTDLMYDSSPDKEGYARAKEGVHTLPFALSLPLDDSYGIPRGVLRIQSKVVVRYIAMV